MDINHTAIEVLAKAQFVSFCRLEMSTLTMDLAEAVRDTGGKVIYDTDDIIHDDTIFLQSEYFARDPKSANQLQLLSKKFVNLMRLADGFTVTTPALLRSVKPFGRPAVIVNNNLSEVLIEQYADAPKRGTRSTINLCYFAGTAVDSTDFDECKVALLNLLLDRPGVVLHIVGSLDVNDLADAAIDGQVQRHGLMSYAAMHVFLRNMDINLAPLADTPFNDALSALKVFEAALHSIPTIASPSEPYGNAIQDRVTGYLARTQQDWSNALYDAVDNPDMRHKIGDAARRIIVCAFSAKNSAKQLSDFLDKMATK
jgi:CDP-glycerol glycerophosphotransferase